MCNCCDNNKAGNIVEVDPLYSPMEGTIVRTRQMTENEQYFEIRLDGGRELGHMPGQFVQFSLFGIGEAPISISSSPARDMYIPSLKISILLVLPEFLKKQKGILKLILQI